MKRRTIISAAALVLICVFALSHSSCGFLKNVEEKMTYEQIRDLSRYKTIVCDGATYRFIESDQDAEDEFSRDGSILLGDEAEYKLADENGVPYDETRSEKGFFFEGDEEKKYIFIPDTATVWTKDGEK